MSRCHHAAPFSTCDQQGAQGSLSLYAEEHGLVSLQELVKLLTPILLELSIIRQRRRGNGYTSHQTYGEHHKM